MEGKKMNCSQCGAVVEEGLKFCRKCGARIETAGDYSESEQQGQLGKQGGLETQGKAENQDELKKSSLGEQKAAEAREEQQGIQLLARPTRLQHPLQGEINNQGLQGFIKPIASESTKGQNAETAAKAEIAATINLKNSQAQALLDEIQNKSQAQNKTQKDSPAAANGQPLSRTQLHKRDGGTKEKKQNTNKAKTFIAKNKIKGEEGKLPKVTRNKEVDTNELKIFFNFMKNFIKQPLMDKEELDEQLEDKNTFIYMGVLLALNTLMSVILMEFVLRGLKDLIDVVAYLMSNLNADIHYLTGKIGLSFIIGSLVMNIGYIVIFAVLMSVIGSRIMKQDIKGQEVCKYMLAPLGVLVVGKLPVIFITILNIKLGLVLYALLVGMMMIIGVTALEKRYGRNRAGIYSISGLYLLSMSISTLAGIKIMMMF